MIGPSGPVKWVSVENIHFEYKSAAIEPDCSKKLSWLAGWLIENSDMVLALDGHADLVGIDDGSPALSEGRVVAVKSALVAAGVDARRIYAEPAGVKALLCHNHTELCAHRNRRVEILIGEQL